MNFLAAMRRQTRMPGALVVGMLLALGACHPAYDWREIHEPEAGYRILLPAKPVSMTRPIDLDGVAVTMSMTGARVDEALFTVGSVVLPSSDEETRAHATQAMRTAMERNVQGHETKVAQIEVPVLDTAGRPAGSVAATHVEVDGSVAGEPAHMSATFVARGDRAWQVVLISPSADREAAKLFHESFRIAK
ncbi:MAG: hypothetical protein LT102_13340 [Burkholderiaceae bacterium]|nr:hypothetical protein [Burkholderiaceae bacterium]